MHDQFNGGKNRKKGATVTAHNYAKSETLIRMTHIITRSMDGRGWGVWGYRVPDGLT